MLKLMISFGISALLLFLSLTCLVYDLQLAGPPNMANTHRSITDHNNERPNFQAILSDIFGSEVVEPPSPIRRLSLLDIALMIIALASAVFMSVFAYILARTWLHQ